MSKIKKTKNSSNLKKIAYYLSPTLISNQLSPNCKDDATGLSNLNNLCVNHNQKVSMKNSDLKCAVLPQKMDWKYINAENLKLKYKLLFDKLHSNMYLKALEKEIIYFTGSLLKVKVYGKWFDIPRKQVAFGDPGLFYSFSGNSIPAMPWTSEILELKNIVESATSHHYNFVLINRYKDGDDYIGEHRDDEKDLVEGAPIASLSFGAERDFIFRHKDSRGCKASKKIDPVKLVLENGSLLLMEWPTNKYWYHSLPKRKNCHNIRVNLTFRNMVTN